MGGGLAGRLRGKMADGMLEGGAILAAMPLSGTIKKNHWPHGQVNYCEDPHLHFLTTTTVNIFLNS